MKEVIEKNLKYIAILNCVVVLITLVKIIFTGNKNEDSNSSSNKNSEVDRIKTETSKEVAA